MGLVVTLFTQKISHARQLQGASRLAEGGAHTSKIKKSLIRLFKLVMPWHGKNQRENSLKKNVLLVINFAKVTEHLLFLRDSSDCVWAAGAT